MKHLLKLDYVRGCTTKTRKTKVPSTSPMLGLDGDLAVRMAAPRPTMIKDTS